MSRPARKEEHGEISSLLGSHHPSTNRETRTCQTQLLCDVDWAGIADHSCVYRDYRVDNAPVSASLWFLNPSRASSCPCLGAARCPAPSVDPTGLTTPPPLWRHSSFDSGPKSDNWDFCPLPYTG